MLKPWIFIARAATKPEIAMPPDANTFNPQRGPFWHRPGGPLTHEVYAAPWKYVAPQAQHANALEQGITSFQDILSGHSTMELHSILTKT